MRRRQNSSGDAQALPVYRVWLLRFKRYRTPVLAVIATAMLVTSAVNTFDVPLREVLSYLLLCVVGVVILAGAAALLVALFKTLLRR